MSNLKFLHVCFVNLRSMTLTIILVQLYWPPFNKKVKCVKGKMDGHCCWAIPSFNGCNYR